MNLSTDPERPQVALSIRQPWAELIVSGRKTIEVRTWTTDYRGAVFIHASKSVAEEFVPLFPDVIPTYLGGLIGIVNVVSVESFSQATWSRLRPGHLVPGPMPKGAFGWKLEKAKRLVHPLPVRGQLGLFPLSEQVLSQVQLKGGFKGEAQQRD
ncbi:ASCH domain-containing protein [Paraburkholderia aspalathi]|uniref:ASCH domain-containing protein n=1 Tax=Paraburkholderia aspalathi TaxID=1324617 RepID=A0A1I7B6B3_9BURK|nr:ASCH domain-containing protein [Paraburkholderia aspalathi]SFT82634.1 ASCH domain-containing protein [Paraburkholderia aspalathi]